jgi:hypothetical protein|tara:strand:- start:790 stop:1311 length:522 start_codon:yes stop_codon:yes gene_type:complete
MYLLSINKAGDIHTDDDGLMLVPEFRVLVDAYGDNAIKYVALICDYDSPYRHYNEKERTRAVSYDLFGVYQYRHRSAKKIADAISKYKEMQFDPLDAQLQAFNEKIDEYTSLMKDVKITEDNAESMQKIMIGIEKILKTRQTLLDAIEKRGKRQKLMGDITMSFLENKYDNNK